MIQESTMNKRLGITAIAICLIVASWGHAQAPAPNPTAKSRIAELVGKLGSSSYVQRELARKELEKIGTPALDALHAAKKTSDVETARRIGELVRLFEEQLLTQQVLAAKEIHLKLTDANVDQAIAELNRLSGYTVQFQGDRIPFADKKITLDTGKTTFWQALDQVCERADLIEKIDPSLNPAINPHQIWGGRGGRVNRIMIDGNAPQAAPAIITLTNRGKEKLLTSYAGAVKSQLRVTRDADTKEMTLQFIVSVEPRLLNNTLASRPILDKVIDQQQQPLTTLLEPTKIDPNANVVQPGIAMLPFDMMPNTGVQQRHAQIRIKEGEQAAKLLKELTGKLTLQLDLANETLAKVEKVLDASGKSVTTNNNGTLKINSVRKTGDEIEVQITLGRGGMQIGGPINRQDLPELIDAKGQKFHLVSSSSDGNTTITNGTMSRSTTIIYRPNPGQAAPSELVLFGLRTYTIAVPFRYENVPLP
jgi:hypothetical protein